MNGFVERAILPIIHAERCTLCGDCVPACPQAALRLVDGRLELDAARCAYCGDCEDVCPTGAIDLPFEIVLSPRVPADGEGDTLCDEAS
jgi:ferredoxin